MKKDLLTQVKEDLNRRFDKDYDLLYSFMKLIPYEFEQYIKLDGNKLYINENEICNLNEVTDVKQIQETGSCSMISIQFEKLDINSGIVYETKIVRLDVFEESYNFDDWVQNPNYHMEMAKLQYEKEYVPVLDGDMPL